MSKRLALLLLVAVNMGWFDAIDAQGYEVQLNVFTHTIEGSFFKYAGYKTVLTRKDKAGFIQYHLDKSSTYNQVENNYQKALKKGFNQARIIGRSPVKYTSVGFHQKEPAYATNQLFIRPISLKNESGIEKEDRNCLEKITKILKENPQLKLRFVLPASALDAGGQKQLKTISNFFLVNKIPAYRMRIEGAHHDFLTAVEKLTYAPTKETGQSTTIVLALINLKEEVIVDTFDHTSTTKQLITSAKEGISSIVKWWKYIK